MVAPVELQWNSRRNATIKPPSRQRYANTTNGINLVFGMKNRLHGVVRLAYFRGVLPVEQDVAGSSPAVGNACFVVV